ncbi:MAG: FG-GAP-like repeat-containing protein [bacterium]
MSKQGQHFVKALLTLFLVFTMAPHSLAQSASAPRVLNISPDRYSLQNLDHATISVQFDLAMNPASFQPQSFVVSGNQTGLHQGSFVYDADAKTMLFNPAIPFQSGERVDVLLTSGIRSAQNTPLSASFQWCFHVKSSAASASFVLDSTYAVADGPHFVGVGDWNGDSRLDLAIPNSNSHDAQIWEDFSNGVFNRKGKIVVGLLPRVLTIADFDHDGDLDLAVANERSNSVTSLFNDASGNFVIADSSLPVDAEPTFITSGDLNGDGFADLVTVNDAGNSISVLPNGGDGSFQAQTVIPVGQSPRSAFLGDFNNDGFLDVAVSSALENRVVILQNDGAGGLVEIQSLNTGQEPHFLIGEDFNLDGQLDLAVANRTSNTISILLNDSPNFSLSEELAVGSDPLAFVVGDWDGDFDPDLAVTNRLSGNLYVFTNDGLGQFALAATYATDVQPRFVNYGDFDADGDLDLIVANWESNTFQVFDNQNASNQNQAPGRPELLGPPERTFVNSGAQELFLRWRAPLDQNDDLLHFRVEISQNGDFSSPDFVFESDKDTGFFPPPPVAQNTDSVAFQVPQTLPDGFYRWHVQAWDGSAFSVPSDSRSFVIDATPPHLDSLVFTNATFQTYWYNPNQVGTAILRIQYDEPFARAGEIDLGRLGAQQRMDNLASGDDQTLELAIDLSAVPDSTYRLYVTLSDSAGNLATDSTEMALDSTPPSLARAQSADTSFVASFLVQWGGTATDGNGAGTSGIYDVQVQIDGGTWQPWLTDFAGESAEFQGSDRHSYGFEAAAHDNVGNVEPFLQTAESVTFVNTSSVDATPPSISNTPVASTVEEGASATVQANIQDNRNVVAATLFYKPSGQTAFQKLDMTDVGGDLFQATLGPELISEKGLNYYIEAWDGSNFAHFPEQNWLQKPVNVSVHVTGANNQGLTRGDSQPSGSEQAAFRMISIPLLLERPDAPSIFEDDFGAYDPDQWRLLQYEPVTMSFTEFPVVDDLTPGKALWLLVKQPQNPLDSGPGTTVPTNVPFQMSLRQGWNFLSDPFNFSVSWKDVEIVQGRPEDLMGPYAFDGQWLLPNEVDILRPWEGFAIFSTVPNSVIALKPVAMDSVQQDSSTIYQAANWFVGLAAVCGEARDSRNFVGVAPAAAEQRDAFDYLEPIPVGDYVSLRFPHDDWVDLPGNFTTDFRPNFTEGQVWNLEVKTNIANQPVSLLLQNVESVPAGFLTILVNKGNAEEIDIRTRPSYFFVPDSASLQTEFELVIGTPEFVSAHFTPEPQLPESFALSQNFPNPFNPTTQIKYSLPNQAKITLTVYDVLGQEVVTLVQDIQEAGEYVIEFDASGLASGVYIYQLLALSSTGGTIHIFEDAKKLIFLK